jgi:cytidylate kinase
VSVSGDRAARIVTLSSTYGGGGSVIAPLLAEHLGLPFADRLIPARDAPAPGPGAECVNEEERLQTALTGGLGLPVPSAADLADPVKVRVEQSIQALVETGGAVILGRAASVVLAGHPRALHVRLDGPKERRIARAIAIERIDQATARARLEETDRARARYLDRLYDRNPADSRLYHLIIDSTVLTAGDCVEIITIAASAFWGAS